MSNLLEAYIAMERLNGTKVSGFKGEYDIFIKNSFLEDATTLNEDSLTIGIKEKQVAVMKNLVIEKLKRTDVTMYEAADQLWYFCIKNITPENYLPFWIELLKCMEALERKWINE